MCEGCRVKMGYVTYGGGKGGGGKKNVQVERAGLKNRENCNMSRETGGEQKKKKYIYIYTRKGIPKET
jgi:hypothetical protein